MDILLELHDLPTCTYLPDLTCTSLPWLLCHSSDNNTTTTTNTNNNNTTCTNKILTSRQPGGACETGTGTHRHDGPKSNHDPPETSPAVDIRRTDETPRASSRTGLPCSCECALECLRAAAACHRLVVAKMDSLRRRSRECPTGVRLWPAEENPLRHPLVDIAGHAESGLCYLLDLMAAIRPIHDSNIPFHPAHMPQSIPASCEHGQSRPAKGARKPAALC